MFAWDRIEIDPAYRERLVTARLDSAAAVLSRRDGEVVAWSRSTDTVRIPSPDGQPGFFIKRYRVHGWYRRIRGLLRGDWLFRHRAGVEYHALDALRRGGVPVTRAVACGSRRVGGLLAASFLITEEVPFAGNLNTFVEGRRQSGPTLSPRQWQSAIRELAFVVSEMHERGRAHGNLFWRNILVRPRPDDSLEFFLLDPEPSPFWRQWFRRDALCRELAQLAVSARPFTTTADRCRFFRAYANRERLTADDARTLRSIWEQAAAWSKHEDRRIRFNGLFDSWRRELVRERGLNTADVPPVAT